MFGPFQSYTSKKKKKREKNIQRFMFVQIFGGVQALFVAILVKMMMICNLEKKKSKNKWER